jgi:hypothetical protein
VCEVCDHKSDSVRCKLILFYQNSPDTSAAMPRTKHSVIAAAVAITLLACFTLSAAQGTVPGLHTFLSEPCACTETNYQLHRACSLPACSEQLQPHAFICDSTKTSDTALHAASLLCRLQIRWQALTLPTWQKLPAPIHRWPWHLWRLVLPGFTDWWLQ